MHGSNGVHSIRADNESFVHDRFGAWFSSVQSLPALPCPVDTALTSACVESTSRIVLLASSQHGAHFTSCQIDPCVVVRAQSTPYRVVWYLVGPHLSHTHTHTHTHASVRTVFLNRFSGRFTSFRVSSHKHLYKNCFHENKAFFMKKQNMQNFTRLI